MKYFLTFILALMFMEGVAQSFESPQLAFNKAANEYIFDNVEQAVNTLNRALKDYPEDKKLRELLEKILKDRQEQEQQQQEQKNSENQQDQEKQEEQQQSEQDQKEQDEQQKQEQQQSEEQNQEEQEKQQQQSEEQSDEEKDAEKKEASSQKENENKEDEENPKDQQEIQQNLEELNISPEKARMILEAMKNNEVQYIQQMQRKPTQRPDDGKPDW